MAAPRAPATRARKRTFSDRSRADDAQLTLPLVGLRTHVPIVRRPLVVVPGSQHLEALLSARCGVGKSPLSTEQEVDATTLPLLEARLARVLLPTVRVASRPLVRTVLRTVVDTSEDARAIARAASIEPADLVDALDAALSTLRDADVDSAQLRKVAERAPPAVAKRALRLAALLDAHEAALAALAVVDGRGVAARLARAMDASPPEVMGDTVVSILGTTRVELRDVASASPGRLAWIERLHAILRARGGGVVIVSPTAHDGFFVACGLDDPRDRFATRLEERLRALPDPPELVHRPVAEAGSILGDVAARLFATRATGERPPLEVGDAVRWVSAAGTAVAAETVAAEVARALRAGHAPERVVVALPTLDEAIVRPLRRALATLGVPTFEPRGAPPTTSPAVATLLEVLRAIGDGARKELVVDLLRGAAARAGSGRLGAARALERVAGSDLVRDGDAILGALDDEARALAAPLVALLRHEDRPTLGEALAHVRAFANALGLPEGMGRGAARIIAGGDDVLLDALAHELASWSALASAIDELGRAVDLADAASMPIAFDDLAREIEGMLAERRSVAGHRAGAVPIARLRDRLGLECDVLVVMETHEGALPARGAVDPLLSRALVAALRAEDPRRAPPPPSQAGALDLLSAIDAIGRTQTRLVVVHRAVDGDGRKQLPGALPLELARVTTLRAHAERAWAIPGAEDGARSPRDVELHAYAHATSLSGVGDALDRDVVHRADTELLRARAFAAAERGASLATPMTGGLTPIAPVARALVERRLGGDAGSPLSVSAAERLLSCPFVVFAERVLRASSDDPVEDDGGAIEAGALAHRCLLEVHVALQVAGLDDVREHDDARALSIADGAIAGVLDAASATSSLQRVRRERIRDDVRALLLADREAARGDGRRFQRGEQPFGKGGSGWPALVVSNARGTVHVAGQVDRIDVDATGIATVVDYKARVPQGTTKSAFFDERRPGSVQIALYARAAREQLAPTPSRVLGRFFGYRERKVPPTPVGHTRTDDTTWRAQAGDAAGGEGLGAIADALVDAVAASVEGFVPPRRGAICARCTQRAACRVPDVVLEGDGGDP